MFSIINNFVISNAGYFATALGAMLLFVIGTPFFSTKGGIPRLFGKILNKKKALLIVILIAAITLFIIGPLIAKGFVYIVHSFTDYVFPTLIVLGAIAIKEWESKMRWKFTVYWLTPLIFGGLWIILEFLI